MGSIRLILLGTAICLFILYFSEIEDKYFREDDLSWSLTNCKEKSNMWITGNCVRYQEGLEDTGKQVICYKKYVDGMCNLEFKRPSTMTFIGRTIFYLGLTIIFLNVPTPSNSRLYW